MRWMATVGSVVLVAVACSGVSEPSSSVAGLEPVSGVQAPPTTFTSGFSGPVDTTPPSFGDSSTLPLVDGFGVVCAGATGGGEAWFARLEGPWTEPGVEREAVAAFYEGFLSSQGFEVIRPVDAPEWVVLDGSSSTDSEGFELVASVTVRPTMHSTTVVAAAAVDRQAFSLAADVMDADEACWSGMELDDAAAGTYAGFDSGDGSDGGLECETEGLLAGFEGRTFGSVEEAIEASGAEEHGVLEPASEVDDASMWWIVDDGAGETVGMLIVDVSGGSPWIAEYELCRELVRAAGSASGVSFPPPQGWEPIPAAELAGSGVSAAWLAPDDDLRLVLIEDEAASLGLSGAATLEEFAAGVELANEPSSAVSDRRITDNGADALYVERHAGAGSSFELLTVSSGGVTARVVFVGPMDVLEANRALIENIFALVSTEDFR